MNRTLKGAYFFNSTDVPIIPNLKDWKIQRRIKKARKMSRWAMKIGDCGAVEKVA